MWGFWLVLTIAFAGCGADGESGSDPSSQPTQLKPTNSAAPTTTTKSGGVAQPDSNSPDVTKDVPLTWYPTVAKTKTKDAQIELLLPQLPKIKTVRISELPCGLGFKEYPYGTSLDVDFTGRNSMIWLAVVLVGEDGSVSTCQTVSFQHDSTPPGKGEIVINNDAVYTIHAA